MEFDRAENVEELRKNVNNVSTEEIINLNKKLYLSILFFILFIANTIVVFLVKAGRLSLIVTLDDEIHLTVISMMSEFMSDFMHTMTFFGSTVFMICLCAALFFIFLWKKHKNMAFSVAGILIVSTILNNVVKWIIRNIPESVGKRIIRKLYNAYYRNK